MYYDALPVKSLGDKAGAFVDDYINFEENQYYDVRTSGSSVLTKALTMPLNELNNLITWCSSGKTTDQIAAKVDSFIVEDFHWVMDATYGMGSINILILYNIISFYDRTYSLYRKKR